MNKLLVKLSITATVGGLLCASPTLAQTPPASGAPKTSSATMTQDPTVEIMYDDVCILRWTTTNPRGSADRYAVASYGTNANALDQTAKSHVRLNPGHQEVMYRVRLTNLEPHTTYYYRVTSMDGNGTSDAVQSGVMKFTTPDPGKRVRNFPQP
jgi:phosphodiesterase/alkaline phosphatase D-like protein